MQNSHDGSYIQSKHDGSFMQGSHDGPDMQGSHDGSHMQGINNGSYIENSRDDHSPCIFFVNHIRFLNIVVGNMVSIHLEVKACDQESLNQEAHVGKLGD